MQKRVLILIPQKDFDPTEVAVPWKILKQADIMLFLQLHKAQ